ncbi:hypothetical protein INT44_000180 [Umbelopsis vinacea]|uniref:Ricin B lectin domain-containing protein n=1 Tax=Umbelopsis vinacea TaxID=44442 RepID=A0A8H7U7G9_9FUNG|nr:hypothetical protein INT44_000180 [Umbelopsis vinacea]
MAEFPDGYFYIQARKSGNALDVDGASTKNDGKIIVWTPKHHGDRDNQLWSYQDGFIVNKNSGKVLDVRGGPLEAGALICQYDRKLIQDAHNQRFGYRDGLIHCLADPRMVLDIKGGTGEKGSRIILYNRKLSVQGNDNQLWDLVPAGEVRAQRELLFEADFGADD